MLQPNWLDTQCGSKWATLTAEDCLKDILTDPKVIEAVKKALADFDANPTKPGPSRTQIIRNTLSRTILANS